MFDAVSFGHDLKLIRRSRGITTRDMPFSSSARISQIESGQKPGVDIFLQVCQWANFEPMDYWKDK